MFPPQYHPSSIHPSIHLSLSLYSSSSFSQPQFINIPPSFHLPFICIRPLLQLLTPDSQFAFFSPSGHPQCHSFFSDATFSIPDPGLLSVATLFTAKTLAESVRFYSGPRPDYLPPVPWLSVIHTYIPRKSRRCWW